MKRLWVVLAVLIIVSGLSGAQGIAASDDLDLDLLFGGEILQELEAVPPETSAVEAILAGERLGIGGSYRLAVDASRLWAEMESPFPMEITRDELRFSLTGDIYADLRPSPTWRAFAKAKYTAALGHESWPQGKSDETFDVSLHEAFLDYTVLDKLYLRFGKQAVSWGVGYLFSPADVINIERIDPLDPEADREGPVALKAHYPVGSSNYYLYLLLEDMDGLQDIGIAPKIEYVMGRSELGLGGFYRKGEPLHLMSTVSSTIGKVSVFGEAALAVATDAGPEENAISWQGTVGGRYSYRDEAELFDITTAGQYLYSDKNGHIVAALVSWNNLLKSRFSASALWLGYVSEDSGLLDFSLNLPAVDFVKPQVGVRHFYGGFESLRGSGTQVYLSVTLGSGAF